MGNLCNKHPNRRHRNPLKTPSISYTQSTRSYQPVKQPQVIKNSSSSLRPHSPKQSRDIGQAGIKNIGNTCFANAALQCILNTPVLIKYLSSDDNSSFNHIRKFTTAISALFQTQWRNKLEKIDPEPILKLV